MERIGDECRANDIPFFLEFIGYDEGADEKGLEFAKKKPQVVTGSMEEFTKDRYGVDVMKVEVPVEHEVRRGDQGFGGEKAYSRQEAMDAFRRSADVATRPFIYLSAGVSNAEFTETLELAGEAGTRFSGVLCGRATWKDGIPDLRQAGRRGVPDVAGRRGGDEHRERERSPKSAQAVVRVLRCEVGRRARVSRGATGLKARRYSFKCPSVVGLSGPAWRRRIAVSSAEMSGPRA